MRNKDKTPLWAAAVTGLLVLPALAFAKAPDKKAETATPYEARDAAAMKKNLEIIERMKPVDARIDPSFLHKRLVKPVRRDLAKDVVKVRAVIHRLVDGAVIYRPLPENAAAPTPREMAAVNPKLLKQAIFLPGVEALAIGKVGDAVTLHLKNDARGFAFVENLTR